MYVSYSEFFLVIIICYQENVGGVAEILGGDSVKLKDPLSRGTTSQLMSFRRRVIELIAS